MLLKTTELSLLRILEYWNAEILAQNTAILDGGRLRSFLRRMLGGQRRKGEHCGMIDVHGRAQTIREDKDEKIASTLEIHMTHSQMFQKVESGGGPIFKVVLEC